ncbi:MAG: FtsK/SpoIIIE domain-containing protein [Streptococcus salivarius]|nr:FtsK/SpoIIIE domain-containing protein [Streptococcus salivarius]
MKKLAKRISGKEWGIVFLAILFTCFQVYLELEVPTYISKITDLLGTQGSNLDELWQPASMMVGMSFLAFLSAVAVGFFASRVAASYTSRLRSDIFNRVLDYSQTEIKKFSIPSLLTRTTNDITQVQMLITMGLQVVTRGPIMAIWAIGKILGHSEYWLWAVLVAVIVNVLMTIVLVTLAFPKQSLIQGLTDKLNSITRESLTGIRVVRAYNAEDYQNEKFAAANDELTRLNLFVNRLMAILNPIMMGISSGLSVAIYWIGAYVINDAAPTERLPLFSDMVVFMSYAMQVVMGFLLTGALFIVLPRTMVSAKRINQVLDLHSSIQNPAQAQLADENLKGQVEFKDVTFRYAANSEAVVEHVSFKAETGQTVAFIGSTGSGKSVAVNGIISSILMKARPDQVKFLMVDPKMVELSVYNDIPHLLIPVVTNPRKAAKALQKVVDEMENRYELFSKFGVRNIAGYNAKVEDWNAQSQEKQIPLPLIVVIVDELADLMMVASKEVEDAIIRLGQKARAAGIHMILATQRPSVDVISGLIKANVPSRVAFAVSSGTDSRTILDENGAEKLLGRGDMLFKPIDENHPVRLQGSFISDDDVERIVTFIKDQASADYDESFDPGEVSENDFGGGSSANGGSSEGDPLFEEAKALVLETQKASASMIQRRLSVGFNRATRLMEELEEAGVIGPAEGTKPRKVLMTQE